LPLATLCLAAIRILLPPLLGCACAITRASLPPLAGALLCRRASSRLGPRIGARLSGTIAGRGIAGAAVLRWLRTRGAPALGAGIIRVVIVWLRSAHKFRACTTNTVYPCTSSNPSNPLPFDKHFQLTT